MSYPDRITTLIDSYFSNSKDFRQSIQVHIGTATLQHTHHSLHFVRFTEHNVTNAGEGASLELSSKMQEMDCKVSCRVLEQPFFFFPSSTVTSSEKNLKRLFPFKCFKA